MYISIPQVQKLKRHKPKGKICSIIAAINVILLCSRFIRTARAFIRRYQNSKNTTNWLEALKICVKHYNRTKSAVTGQTPLDILTNEEADWAAFEKLYGTKVQQTSAEPNKNDPKPNSKVRLSRLKNPFEKESTGKGEYNCNCRKNNR